MQRFLIHSVAVMAVGLFTLGAAQAGPPAGGHSGPSGGNHGVNHGSHTVKNHGSHQGHQVHHGHQGHKVHNGHHGHQAHRGHHGFHSNAPRRFARIQSNWNKHWHARYRCWVYDDPTYNCSYFWSADEQTYCVLADDSDDSNDSDE